MKFARSLSLMLAGILLGIPALSRAHFLWATIDVKTKAVVVQFNEAPGPDSLELNAERRGRLKAFGKPGEVLALKAEDTSLVSAPGPKSAVVE
ncbi:MAG: hypothetical protein EOO22_16995, partial [Comamonadaceae bacterium]